MQNRHSRILLRDLLRGRIREMRREPEVPDARVPVVECLDGPARITSKELAIIHSVINGTLQNACSTRPKSGCRFGEKCSHAHRQVDEQPSKKVFFYKMVTNVQWLCRKLHENWVAFFKIWSRRSLQRFCGRAQTY